MTIFKNSNYRLDYQAAQNLLQFFWEAGHEKMDYEDFQEACCNFLGYGLNTKPNNF